MLGESNVMLSFNNLIYIWGLDNTDWQGNVLWVTDGTADGFRHLADFDGEWEYTDYAVMDNVIYFSGRYGLNLWRTDGTACGTFKVSTGLQYAWPVEGVGTTLLFSAYRFNTGLEPNIYKNINSLVTSPCGTPTTAAREGTYESSTDAIITAYPNPYTQEFSLRFNAGETAVADIAVFTNTGFPVETFRGIHTNKDYEHLGATWPKGMYIVKVSMGGKLSTHMVVKK
jgi:hypothetical protein